MAVVANPTISAQLYIYTFLPLYQQLFLTSSRSLSTHVRFQLTLAFYPLSLSTYSRFQPTLALVNPLSAFFRHT